MSNDNTKIEPPVIPHNSIVKVTSMNGIFELQHMEFRNNKQTIQKIDKDTYLVFDTGEIKEYKHIENRAGSFNSIRQTLKKLRNLINTNFTGEKNEGFWTFTYAENMTDKDRLYLDYKNFWKRLKYFMDKNYNANNIDYIAIAEPQGRGAWHLHVLVKAHDLKSLYISKKDLESLWSHGFATPKGVEDVDNIGAYFSAYLADLELEEKEDGTFNVDLTLDEMFKLKGEIITKEVDGKNKSFVKGGRLHLYPPGMNLFRTSRGIKRPTSEMMRKSKFLEKIQKKAGSAQPHFSKDYKVKTDDFENIITYEQYNLRR